MSEFVNIEVAKDIMGTNIIGSDELNSFSVMKLDVSRISKIIPFSVKILNEKKDEYILIPGISRFQDGTSVTIRNMIKVFGKEPDKYEPCFYNQDWYDNESFVDVPMKDGWYFIRKRVFDESRAKQPQELIDSYCFPSAIFCTYAFFVIWLALGEKLWYHDFVWCSDKDHNGDRIYVGKYHDIDNKNKNGFNIHRHLSLRSCYACIDFAEK